MVLKTTTKVLLYCFIWFSTIYYSLPKLFHSISSKRGVPVRKCRRLENLTIKLAKRGLDVKYWTRCLDLGICPKFLNFKPPKVKQFRYVGDLYQSVVQKGLCIAREEQLQVEKEYNIVRKNVTDHLSLLEKGTLLKLLNEKVKSETKKFTDTHNKKLLNLWMSTRPRSPDCLKNLSSKELSVEEQNVLYRGLKHHVLPRKIHPDQIKAEMEKLVNAVIVDEVRSVINQEQNAAVHSAGVRTRAQAARNERNVLSREAQKEKFRETIVNVTQQKVTADFRDDMKGVFRSFVQSCRNVCSTRINQAFHSTVYGLSKNKDIVCVKYDKGNGICVMDTSDYLSKLDCIVNDEGKFAKILPSTRKNARYPTIRRQEIVRDLIDKHIKEHVSTDMYKRLVPVGCGPGKLYGTCKVHKPDYPLRPVVSMLRTPEYELAKYLDSMIKPNIPDKFMLYSTDNFLQKLNKFKIQPGDKSISFDVVSLFTNVPLNETIQIIANHMYSKSAKFTPPFEKSGFVHLMKIATGGMFLHRDSLYKQEDGVSMGNPLAPTMANFFLGFLEETLFKNTDPDYPVFYVRYVDDVFCIFRNNVDFKNFFERLNSLHVSLKFTYEESRGSTLPFLDVEVKLTGEGCETSIYRKPTNTNTLLHFDAVVPLRWKSGLVMCMLNRAHRLSSSVQLFHKEVMKLKHIFELNSYPVQFFNKIYKRFEQKLNQTSQDCTEEDIDNKYNLKIPFVGKPSIEFGKRVSALIEKQFGVQVNVIFSTARLGSFFPLKCLTPLPVQSCVVYRYKCLGDQDTSYIGMTVRTLSERVREHIRGGRESAVHDHITSCQTCNQNDISIENFSIIKKCRTEFDTKIHEALLIKKHNPNLNRQLHLNRGASFTLKIFE